MGWRGENFLVEAGDAEPGVEPAGFDCAGASCGGEVGEMGEELFRCKEGGDCVVVGGIFGVGVVRGVATSAPGYSAASYHAVEHCFDVADYCVCARGGARGEEPAAFVRVCEHGASGWIEAAGLGRGGLDWVRVLDRRREELH